MGVLNYQIDKCQIVVLKMNVMVLLSFPLEIKEEQNKVRRDLKLVPKLII
jgi:hypothetical protein